jgi:eukaryotic-like serine/threonine-protein kinase
VFGTYRTIREIGRGGMGIVYEADEIDSGRRVALKVLAGRIEDERARERFVREGRLAASVQHPHCVFVFGATEVDGHPVIAMELMAETVADRLKREGPLAPTVAVDVVLQVIAGLQAAAAAGILHRDVKPSNCFVDAHGVVKIGDFGISQSQRPTEETRLPTREEIVGTPAYAAPEQLRGAPLDLRADMYSVGATLYELLIGRRPFEGSDVLELLMRIANDPPVAPHAINRAIPRGLSGVIVQCLAKSADQRFADYDALAAALEPYSSSGATAATLGKRFVAGAIDNWLVGLPVGAWMLSRGGDVRDVGLLLGALLFMLLYFVIAESLWAATPGKALLGLQVSGRGGEPARPRAIAVRAALYTGCFNVNGVLMLAFQDAVVSLGAGQPLTALLLQTLQWVLLALLFSTARRANGYAGLHDLATQIRVVERRLRPAAKPSAAPSVAKSEPVTGRLGAFDLLSADVCGLPEGWRWGFDDRLRRPVWIRLVAPGTPPIPLRRQTLSRATRLRWLAGRRQENEAWDAFEGVDGSPLTDACARPREWVDVRWWLLDLARECAAASSDDRAPQRLDRVWVLASGGAKLIDDPTVDLAGPEQPAASGRDLQLVSDVARTAQLGCVPQSASGARPCLWPLSARRLLDTLPTASAFDLASVARSFEALTRRRAAVTRAWRALPIAIPVFMVVTAVTAVTLGAQSLIAQLERVPMDVRIVATGLAQLRRADRGTMTLSAKDREAIEHALVTRYRAILRNTDQIASTQQIIPIFTKSERDIAADLLRRYPVDPDRSDSTDAAVDALRKASAIDMPPAPFIVLALLIVIFVGIALASLTCALIVRGGLMRLLQLDLVDARGRPASRARVFARSVVASSPLIALVVWLIAFDVPVAAHSSGFVVACAVTLLVLLVGAIVAVATPARGIHDRLAGTWIVPQ